MAHRATILSLELAALQLRDHLQGFLDVGISQFKALRHAQFPLAFFEVAGATVDKTEVLVEIAFRRATSADLNRLFELGDRLIPIASTGGRQREIAEGVCPLGDTT